MLLELLLGWDGWKVGVEIVSWGETGEEEGAEEGIAQVRIWCMSWGSHDRDSKSLHSTVKAMPNP